MKLNNLAIVNNGANITHILSSFIEKITSEDPFYIVNLGSISNKLATWKEQLPRVKPFYAVKCNNDETMLRTMADLGLGFDCASKSEIEEVLSLGVDRSRIIYANPCKTNSHIRYATKVGVNLMTFDNSVELEKIHNINPNAEAVIRIKCDAKKSQCPNFGDKYGADVEEAQQLLQIARDLDVTVVGVSFHVGSGCEDLTAYPRAIEYCRRVFDEGLAMGFPMNILDIGGGFPGTEDSPITFTQFCDGIRSALEEHFPEDVEIIAEPGRYFAASAFTLCTSVIAKRQVSGEDGSVGFMYYINDGLYGSFNCLLYDHAVVTASVFKEGEVYSSSVWGPTCDSLDKVLEQCYLPELDVGDRIYFENLGAYTIAAATTFNGFTKPKLYFYASKYDWNILSHSLSDATVKSLEELDSGGVDMSEDFSVWRKESLLLAKKLEKLAPNDVVYDNADDTTFTLLSPFL